MAKKYKYQYWHIVTKINPDRPDLNIEIGNCVSNKYIRNGLWETFNMKYGKFSWMCEAEYIGRTDTDMPKEQKLEKLKEFKEKWESSNSKLK